MTNLAAGVWRLRRVVKGNRAPAGSIDHPDDYRNETVRILHPHGSGSMELIARDCGVANADDRVDALVAYSQTYGLDVIHWHMRYPELAQDRGFPRRQQLSAPTDWGLRADVAEFSDQERSP